MRNAWLRRSVSTLTVASVYAVVTYGQCPDLTDYTTGWPSGASVVTYFLSNSELGGTFSGGQANAVCCSSGSAFYNWNTTLDSLLTLSQDIEDSLDELPSSNYVLVEYGDTSGCGESKAACTTYSTCGYAISSATIYVNVLGTDKCGLAGTDGSRAWTHLWSGGVRRLREQRHNNGRIRH